MIRRSRQVHIQPFSLTGVEPDRGTRILFNFNHPGPTPRNSGETHPAYAGISLATVTCPRP